MDEAELKRARFCALKIINFRPRSVEELTQKLKEKGFSGEVITQILPEFSKKGLVDDAKFSRLWVSSRMAAKPKGKALLRRELKQKGVADEVISGILKESGEEYDEYEVVRKLADERMRCLAGLDKTTAKRRLFGYLRRRGFSVDMIMRVIKEEV